MVIITGGAGFFGGILKRKLLALGQTCISIDLLPDQDLHPLLTSLQTDLCDPQLIDRLPTKHGIDTIYHCAATLAHSKINPKKIYEMNVQSTQAVAELGKQLGVKNIVYISTNCLWAENFHRSITESDIPNPVEPYGLSKQQSELILKHYASVMNIVIIRCPTIISEDRLGLLSILFDFIREGRTLWTIGNGDNRYQFIYAEDLADACMLAASHSKNGHDVYEIYNIGSDNVDTLHNVFYYVIQHSKSDSTIKKLPKKPAVFLMKLAYWMNVSPLGPYHYRMICEDFIFDTTKIKQKLNWHPTLKNDEMLLKAYNYYNANYQLIKQRKDVSDHRKPCSMGIIRLLKWLS